MQVPSNQLNSQITTHLIMLFTQLPGLSVGYYDCGPVIESLCRERGICGGKILDFVGFSRDSRFLEFNSINITHISNFLFCYMTFHFSFVHLVSFHFHNIHGA